MKVNVPLDRGFLPDKYAKKAAPEFQLEDHPIVSFPIDIQDAPAGTQTFALTLVDLNASRELHDFIQGNNSAAGYLVGGDQKISRNYLGPRPPEGVHNYTLTVYALDTELPLENGYWMNELLDAMKGHVLEKVKVELPYEG